MDDDEKSEIATAIRLLAHAITASAAPGHDAQGGTVDSLTEAVMGMTAALTEIAGRLESLEGIEVALQTIAEKKK
jgi:hypothetical protein